MNFWNGKRVFLTGHTGFKGAWLALWLQRLGADVTGYALPPVAGEPNLFDLAAVESSCRSVFGDVRDRDRLDRAMRESRPHVVLHLAAQALVRASYASPAETFSTNVQGTVNVLDVAREVAGIKAIVVVTSDKVYANDGSGKPYREDDRLGGTDPYSASKACAELVVASYRESYFRESGVRLASARAGNVIGGGDRAQDRLVPDIVRALESGSMLTLRYPDAVRPWQHVLDPLHGYLRLAQALVERASASRAWNFGPANDRVHTVGELSDRLLSAWAPDAVWLREKGTAFREHARLTLDAGAAANELDVRSRLPFEKASEWTMDWYRRAFEGADPRALCLDQIARYEALA